MTHKLQLAREGVGKVGEPLCIRIRHVAVGTLNRDISRYRRQLSTLALSRDQEGDVVRLSHGGNPLASGSAHGSLSPTARGMIGGDRREHSTVQRPAMSLYCYDVGHDPTVFASTITPARSIAGYMLWWPPRGNSRADKVGLAFSDIFIIFWRGPRVRSRPIAPAQFGLTQPSLVCSSI